MARKGSFVQIGVTIAAIVLLGLVAQAQTWTVIHSFSGPDGSYPGAGLTMDAAGNLYGTTSGGGAHDAGDRLQAHAQIVRMDVHAAL